MGRGPDAVGLRVSACRSRPAEGPQTMRPIYPGIYGWPRPAIILKFKCMLRVEIVEGMRKN